MNTSKAYKNVVKMIVGIALFITAMGMACDEGPTGNPITAPVTNIESQIINAVDSDCSDNVLSGC